MYKTMRNLSCLSSRESLGNFREFTYTLEKSEKSQETRKKLLESGKLFWAPVYLKGVLRDYPCMSVRPSVVHNPSFNISEIHPLAFLVFFMKLGHHKGTKVTA